MNFTALIQKSGERHGNKRRIRLVSITAGSQPTPRTIALPPPEPQGDEPQGGEPHEEEEDAGRRHSVGMRSISAMLLLVEEEPEDTPPAHQ